MHPTHLVHHTTAPPVPLGQGGSLRAPLPVRGLPAVGAGAVRRPV